MIYSVSDMHGDLDKFERLLELIQLSDADQLYIIGDVIDRGAMGVDILQKIMAAPNMTMLLGNHEQMCLDTLGPHNEYGARDLWRQNGGSPTYRELLYHRTPHEQNMILRFLASLPDHLDIVVGTQKFHLVHGCPSIDRETRIWGRVSAESRSPYPDVICIVGHTPTNFLTRNEDEDFRIWHGDGIINIDCGCGHLRTEHRRLACLRLDDMAEFYVGGGPAVERAAPCQLRNWSRSMSRTCPRRSSGIWTPIGKGLRRMSPIWTACGVSCTAVSTPPSGAERFQKTRPAACGRSICSEADEIFPISEGVMV